MATHEAVAIVHERAIGGQSLMRILDFLSLRRGLPQAIRTDNGKEFCGLAMLKVRDKGIEVVLFESILNVLTYFNSRVMSDLQALKAEADVIMANRSSLELADLARKIFPRDLFGSG